MKILVTGSAGFIGFHVAKYLLERNDTVFGLDNFNPYYSVKLKQDRDAEPRKYSKYKSIIMDLCDSDKLRDLFVSEKFDKVCNIAAQAGVRYSLEHPHAYINSNIVGFLNILDRCRHNHISRLVYASSSAVIPNSPSRKRTESIIPEASMQPAKNQMS